MNSDMFRFNSLRTYSSPQTHLGRTASRSRLAVLSLLVAACSGGCATDEPWDLLKAPGDMADETLRRRPPPGAPAAPDGLQAIGWSVTFQSFARVSWHDNSNNENGFELEWRLTHPRRGGTYTLVAETTSATVSAFPNDSPEFRVRAFNDFGESGWTPWVSVDWQ